jgi:multisubunit Na+/H+ antiporter MnhB subunit
VFVFYSVILNSLKALRLAYRQSEQSQSLSPTFEREVSYKISQEQSISTSLFFYYFYTLTVFEVLFISVLYVTNYNKLNKIIIPNKNSINFVSFGLLFSF